MEFTSLELAVSAVFGESKRAMSRQAVYGGDINRAYRLTLSDGSAVFMKCNAAANIDFFRKEVDGLNALWAARTIGVPEPLALGVDRRQGFSFLLMEYLDTAPKRKDYWETFGHELARLHRAATAELVSENRALPFGFRTDNYIGASRQINTPKTGWIDFYRDCRLYPQIRMAGQKLDSATRRKCESLLQRLDTLLSEPEFPSLLHGDLWSGNAVGGPDGKAWIYDPAAYVGHFEAELAMTELFGGFPATFYGAYHEANPIDPGYRERRDLYNLYHMLNHLNLFGGSYLSAVRGILNRYA
ncbi:MAG: fructosamine kinase family protein [Clostridiales bacterium]|nr:fructosamine kinase family protein [Clostridiales bacterium]